MPDPHRADMILLRAQKVDGHLADFAARLETISGLAVAYVLDERKGRIAAHGRTKISLTRNACTAAGLFCPRDFAWRCGDYGLYLARAQFPEIRRFWQIESDVRVAGNQPERFFSCLASFDLDFLASYLEPAGPEWAWTRSIASKEGVAYKCFFPVVRVSAVAIDALHAKRREHSRSLARRLHWPNDEGFVATTLIAAGFSWSDLNQLGEDFYRPEEFSFETLCDGDRAVLTEGRTRLVHPVLYGEALRHKARRLERRSGPRTLWQRLRTGIGPARGIGHVVARHNGSRPW